jgi:hypothetical protein
MIKSDLRVLTTPFLTTTVYCYLAWEIGEGCQYMKDSSMLYRVPFSQHERRMRNVILKSIICLAVTVLLHFFPLSGTILGQNVLGITYVF